MSRTTGPRLPGESAASAALAAMGRPTGARLPVLPATGNR